MDMMDELTQAVAQAAGLTPQQARAAVDGMLRYLAAKLSSPQFGEFQARLHSPAQPGDSAPPPAPSP